MTFVRHYVMKAAFGREGDLSQQLALLAGEIKKLKGNLSVEIMQDCRDKSRFFFIEKWRFIEDYEINRANMPNSILKGIMEKLEHRPESASLNVLDTHPSPQAAGTDPAFALDGGH